MLYVPTVMLYFVGVSVFALGPGHSALADNKNFAMAASVALLALLTILNIVGLGVGKWLNNVGAIGTFVAAAVLIGLGITVWSRFGSPESAADFRIPADPKFVLNSFGVICFGLVGLELASIMGDEIRDPQKTLPGAVAWGGERFAWADGAAALVVVAIILWSAYNLLRTSGLILLHWYRTPFDDQPEVPESITSTGPEGGSNKTGGAGSETAHARSPDIRDSRRPGVFPGDQGAL